MTDNLQKFLFKYGINTTTNFDLKNIAKDLGLKIKVLMRDELNSSSLDQRSSRDELNSSSLGQSPSRDENFENTKKDLIILNLESSKEEGSHWVSLYKNKYYFDPYGILPPKNIMGDAQHKADYEMWNGNASTPTPLMWNTLQIQPDNTNMCGQLCLYILYRLEKFNEDFEDLILTVYEEMNDLID